MNSLPESEEFDIAEVKWRRTAKRLYKDLVGLGYTGSYDRVAAFVRQWRQTQQDAKLQATKHAYVPLQFAPGEAFQFDWSEDWVKINGVSTKLQIAHFQLSYSRAYFMRAYLTQSHEMLFDAHYHAFVAFGGIPERGIYDNKNLTTGYRSVARYCGRKLPTLNSGTAHWPNAWRTSNRR